MKKKKKICFIQSFSYTFFNPEYKTGHGGSERQMYFLAKEIAKDSNYDVTFLVGDFGQEKEEEYDGIKVIKSFRTEYSNNLLYKVLYSFKYFLLLKKVNADIYITSSANTVVALVTLFSRIFGKKNIHRTAHQIDVDGTYEKKNGILGKFYGYGIQKATAIITQNEDHQKLLMENYNKEAYLFKNVYQIQPLEVDKEVKKNIFWASRSEKWKNPHIFLDIVERYSEYSFVMGLIKSHDDDFYKEIVNRAKLLKNLTLYTPVPHDKMQDIFKESKIFINTSDFEGFPNTFIEAGMNGTPIFSLSVNPDDMFGKYSCGFYADGDPSVLSDKIEEFMTNDKLFNRHSDGVYDYVVKNHSLDKGIQKLKNIIDKISNV
jgi:glycosyltransferase involved in cell wall biosynthesis